MRKHYWLYLCLFTSLFASNDLRSVKAQTSIQNPRQRTDAWLRESWRGDESSWKALRRTLESEITQAKYSVQFLRRLQVQATEKPEDARAQYRWGLGAFRVASEGSAQAVNLAERMMPHAALALSKVSSPRVAEFARLRFLLEAKQFPSPRLRQVGERLVKLSPRDYSVRYRLVKILDPGRSSSEKQQALVYAQDLVRLDPTRPSAHASLASVYLRAWLVNKHPHDKQLALASYNRYLSLAPQNDPFRLHSQRLISILSAKS